MKKIIILLGLLLLVSNSAFAECTDYKCVTPYDMNSKFRTVIGSITGLNAITEKAVEQLLKREILKVRDAESLKVDVQSYSAKDLKNGIFKSATIEAKDAVINDIYVTSLLMKTLCDFNYVKESGKNLLFMEDLPMSFDLESSENDLNRTMQNEKYQKVINDLNKLGASYGYGLKIAYTKASIKNNKLYYVIGMDVPFIKNTQKLVLEASVYVKNGKISYNNTRIVSGFMKLDFKKLNFILDYLNPLDFSVNIIKDKDANVKVKNVKLQRNVVLIDGVVVIPKD